MKTSTLKKCYLVLIAFSIITLLYAFSYYIKSHYILPKKKKAYPIQKVYVINLDRSKDRWNKIHNDLTREGIEHVRYPAVDGLKLRITSDSGQTFTGADLKSGKYKIRLGETYKVFCNTVTLKYIFDPLVDPDPMSAGELGCFCSHVEVMRDALRTVKHDQSIMVMEDDADIPDGFKSKIDDLALNLFAAKNWGIINLNRFQIPRNGVKRMIGRNIEKVKYSIGMQAYLLNKESIERILSATLKGIGTRSDVAIFLQNAADVGIWIPTDIHVGQISSGSNIMEYMGKCGVYKNCKE